MTVSAFYLLFCSSVVYTSWYCGRYGFHVYAVIMQRVRIRMSALNWACDMFSWFKNHSALRRNTPGWTRCADTLSSPTTFTTMRPIGYLSGSELSTLLEQPDAASAVRVVDVRDSDFEGGHIRGATHIPAHQFLANAGAYATRWRGEQRVVFHWYAAVLVGRRAVGAEGITPLWW